MKIGVFTLYEGSYHKGVAALANSLIRAGFTGPFFAGYRDSIPDWARRIGASAEQRACAHGLDIGFFRCNPARHLGYHKPIAALELLHERPDLDAVVYADPDVVVLSDWPWIENWVKSGIALCQDSNFPWVHSAHPWRNDWRKLIEAAGGKQTSSIECYPNGGFFGVSKQRVSFLETWGKLTLEFEKRGGNTRKYLSSSRTQAIVTDQDLMGAAMMATNEEFSLLGPEGMGFNGHFLFLSHAIEAPKPWDKSFLLSSIKGEKPSTASYWYRRFANEPIVVDEAIARAIDTVDYNLAKVISRFYSR